MSFEPASAAKWFFFKCPFEHKDIWPESIGNWGYIDELKITELAFNLYLYDW